MSYSDLPINIIGYTVDNNEIMGNNGKQYLLAIQHVLLGNISSIYNTGSNIYTIDKKDQ